MIVILIYLLTTYYVVEIFKNLENNKYQTTLLSGDKEEKCNIIASKLGINNVFSQQLPVDKIKKIEELVSLSPTAMIGDGINDAPALAKATIGISIANATQIAIQSSDIVLLNNKT